MIEFERVTKYFAGQAAVKNLSLTLAEEALAFCWGRRVPASRPR